MIRDDAGLRSRVIVHADDFGETTEITRGILECVEAGSVTSTSILANMPATTLALREASRRGREASFGVHLNFCEGRPLTRCPSLTGTGGDFHSKRGLSLRAMAGRLDLHEVAGEVRAQIEAIRTAGVQVSHLDAHKHLHQLPGVALAVVEAARSCGIERVRCTLEERLWTAGARPAAAASRLIRLRLARRFRTLLLSRGLRTTHRVLDLRQILACPDRSTQVALLRRPGTLSEIFCHPGTEQADREKPGSCDRRVESRFLLSREFGDLLREAGAQPVTWWEV